MRKRIKSTIIIASSKQARVEKRIIKSTSKTNLHMKPLKAIIDSEKEEMEKNRWKLPMFELNVDEVPKKLIYTVCMEIEFIVSSREIPGRDSKLLEKAKEWMRVYQERYDQLHKRIGFKSKTLKFKDGREIK